MMFALLELLTVRRVLGRHGQEQETNSIVQGLVIDPLLLREWQMMTVLVLLSRLTLTGMPLSGLSWASSGAFMAWKSLQMFHQLIARLLLLRSMVNDGGFSGIFPACLSLGTIAPGRQ